MTRILIASSFLSSNVLLHFPEGSVINSISLLNGTVVENAIWVYLVFIPQVNTHSGVGPLRLEKILLDFRILQRSVEF